MFDFSSYLQPRQIVGFFKNTTDVKKLIMNFINSEQAKNFVIQDLGYDYEDLKTNISMAVMNSKKSDYGLRKQQAEEQSKKLEIYKKLSGQLISENGFSYFAAVIMAAGFVGIDPRLVIQHLSEKGYTATKQRIENFYKTNLGFFKRVMKKRGVSIQGWNDSLDADELTPAGVSVQTEKKTEKIEIPDIKLEDELT